LSLLIILTTHPIQYQVPLWQTLARDGRVPFEVWYLTRHGVEVSPDREFGKSFAWDLDMLSGYPHQFLDVLPGAAPNSFWKCRLRESLADRLRASGATALWVQGWQVAAYWQAVWAAKRVGVEVWLRGESNDLAPTALWKRPIKRLLLGQLFRRVDRFLCIGTANKRLYQKFGVPESRLYPAPYAVDNERFAKQAEQIRNQKAESRNQWNIPEDAFCVLFCGKFIPKKRPFDLITAVQILTAENPKNTARPSRNQRSADSLVRAKALLPQEHADKAVRAPEESSRHASFLTDSGAKATIKQSVHLLFVGSGELGAQLRACCHVVFDAKNPNFQLSTYKFQLSHASFAGFLNQTEISRAYVAADCLVLPSDYGETWGLVVNEAMASGLPCVISDQCGCAEDLGKSGPNLVFPCGDIRTLADCLFKMAGHRESSLRQPPSLDETVATVTSLCEDKRS